MENDVNDETSEPNVMITIYGETNEAFEQNPADETSDHKNFMLDSSGSPTALTDDNKIPTALSTSNEGPVVLGESNETATVDGDSNGTSTVLSKRSGGPAVTGDSNETPTALTSSNGSPTVLSETVPTASNVIDSGFSERRTKVAKIPEGGWGWLIVLSSLCIHLIIGGLDRSSGILYLKFEERFNQPAAVTAWVPSICTGLRLTLGPVVGMLCNKYSYRFVVSVGGIVVVISAILSGYATSIYLLFFTYGVLGGIGHAMTYSPAVVAISEYFSKKQGTAVGIGTSGVGVGMFVVPILLEASFEYYGFSGAFVIIATLAIELVVCGALLRPIFIHRKILGLDERPRSISVYSTNYLNPKDDTSRNKSITPYDITLTVPPTQFAKQQKRKSVIIENIRRLSTFFVANHGKDKTSSKLCDLSLIKNLRFTSFNISIMVFTLAFQTGIVFFPPFALQIGASEFEAALTITIIGLSDFLGRIIVGVLFDRPSIAPLKVYIYSGLMVSMGVLFICVPYVTTFPQLSAVCFIFGMLTGMYISQKSVVLLDFVRVEQLTQAFGILLFFQGLGVLIGPPVSGILKDVMGTYDYGFYVGGIGVLVGALVLITATLIHRFKT